MELKIVPVQPEGLLNNIPLVQREPEQLDLVLNIRFGEHSEEIFGGSVTFGLKRGELKVELTNGEVPLENIKLDNKFQTVVQKKVQVETASESQIGAAVTANPGVRASSRETKKTAENVEYKEYQVRTKGGLKDPTWVFEVKTDKEILQGLLQDAELAIIDVKAKPCSLVATFNVTRPEDLRLTDAQWLWRKNITKKKLAVIERGIVRHFLEKKVKLEPYLSRVDLPHG